MAFVYEENACSQSYNEYAVNALLGGDGGGSPAAATAARAGAQPRASNVEAGSGWMVSTLTGINDDGIIIGVGVPNSDGNDGPTSSAAADAGSGHALLGAPVSYKDFW